MTKILRQVSAFRSEIAAFEKNANDKTYKFRIKEFDKNGKLILDCEYRPNSEIDWETIYKYDDKDRLVSKQTNYVSEDTSEKTVSSYDEKGNKISEANYFGEELFETVIYRYDENNKILEQKKIDEEEEELEKQEFEYSEDGKLSRQVFYLNGVVERTIIFKYDEAGHCIEEIHAIGNKKETEIIQFTYDEHGNKLTTTSRNSGGKVVGFLEVEYDEQHNPVKYINETAGYYSSKTVHQIHYDEQGRTVENEYFDILNNFLISKELFEYDENGNIVEEEIFEINQQAGMQKTHFRLKMEFDYYED